MLNRNVIKNKCSYQSIEFFKYTFSYACHKSYSFTEAITNQKFNIIDLQNKKSIINIMFFLVNIMVFLQKLSITYDLYNIINDINTNIQNLLLVIFHFS